MAPMNDDLHCSAASAVQAKLDIGIVGWNWKSVVVRRSKARQKTKKAQ